MQCHGVRAGRVSDPFCLVSSLILPRGKRSESTEESPLVIELVVTVTDPFQGHEDHIEKAGLDYPGP